MALAVANEANATGGTSQTTIAVTQGASVAVGDAIEVFVTHDGTAPTYAVADNLGGGGAANVYTARKTCSGASGCGATFTCYVTTAGTPTITMTFGAARGNRCIWSKKITGATPNYDTGAAAYQATPGTGADGVDTGVGATLSTQPAMYSSVGSSITGTPIPAIGTGYTEGTGSPGWNLGGGNIARSEKKSVVVTTADNATYTAGSNIAHISMMHAWIEAAVISPLPNKFIVSAQTHGVDGVGMLYKGAPPYYVPVQLMSKFLTVMP